MTDPKTLQRDLFKTLRRKNAAANVQRLLAAGVNIEERDAAGRLSAR